MNLSVHMITSIIGMIILYPFIGLHSLWFFVGGFLIDTDHYLYNIFKFKTLSIKKAYRYYFYKEGRGTGNFHLHIFHTVEFWLLMIIMAFLTRAYPLFFYMFTITFAGMILHVALDFIDLFRKDIIDVRAISILQWLLRTKR